MAFQAITSPSSSNSCCCSSALPIRSSGAAGPSPMAAISASVCALRSGGDGLRSIARGRASLSSSGTSIMKISISSRRESRRTPLCIIRAGIRAVETYDASFQLQPEADRTLRESLSSETFCAQVAEQAMASADVIYEFTGEIFQPVPWSPTTKFGMPVEFEKFLQDKENYTVINVPPNFMFKAKIFKPSRLCAIFKRMRSS